MITHLTLNTVNLTGTDLVKIMSDFSLACKIC